MKRFFKDNRAVTAIEFAIIAPVFFLLFLGIVEIGLTMFFESSLNLGIRSVARQGVPQGYPAGDNSQILNIMNANLGGLYDQSRAVLIIKTYSDFDDPQLASDRNAFLANPDSFFNNGSSAVPAAATQNGHVILYGVRYTWGGITKLLSPFIPQFLYSFSVAKNEAFS